MLTYKTEKYKIKELLLTRLGMLVWLITFLIMMSNVKTYSDYVMLYIAQMSGITIMYVNRENDYVSLYAEVILITLQSVINAVLFTVAPLTVANCAVGMAEVTLISRMIISRNKVNERIALLFAVVCIITCPYQMPACAFMLFVIWGLQVKDRNVRRLLRMFLLIPAIATIFMLFQQQYGSLYMLPSLMASMLLVYHYLNRTNMIPKWLRYSYSRIYA